MPNRKLPTSKEYAKEAAESLRGSRNIGRIPKAKLREIARTHRNMRDRLRAKELKNNKKLADEHRAAQVKAIKEAKKAGQSKEVIKRMIEKARETQKILDKAAK